MFFHPEFSQNSFAKSLSKSGLPTKRVRPNVKNSINPCSFLCSCLLVLVASTTTQAAAIYKKVDADGNVTFTDVPPRAEETAETIDLESPNSFKADVPDAGPQETTSVETTDANDAVAAPEYTALVIVSPTDDMAIRDNAGTIEVTTSLEPSLADNHVMRLLLDGAPVAETNQTGNFTLENVDRGTHELQAQVLNDTGDVVFAGQPSVFHMLRYSALAPGRPRPELQGRNN
jgi:hypothetical protein